MAKHINLTDKFDNEKPTVTVNDHIFTINDEDIDDIEKRFQEWKQ